MRGVLPGAARVLGGDGVTDWKQLAKSRQWIITILERRIDELEDELREVQEARR